MGTESTGLLTAAQPQGNASTSVEVVRDVEEQRKYFRRMEAGRKAASILAGEVERPPYATDDEQLAALATDGAAARDEFFAANLPLVRSIVQGYLYTDKPELQHDLEYGELFHEGCCGLLEAIAGFDYQRGTKFSTYAVPHILKNILAAIPEQGRSVPIPSDDYYKIVKVYKIFYALARAYGRDPSLAEVASAMEEATGNPTDPAKVADLLQYGKAATSIYRRLARHNGDESAFELLALLPDLSQQERVGEINLERTVLHAFAKALKNRAMSKRQASLVLLRFGFDGVGYERTDNEVARYVGMTRRVVEQHINRGMHALRAAFDDADPR